MSGNLIITIGRQSGSGGKKIGEMLAEKLGVKCYDKELLAQAAKHSGLCEELFEKHDERPTPFRSASDAVWSVFSRIAKVQST